MSTYYNISALENSTTFSEYLYEVNNVSSGFLFQMIVIVLALVTFMSLSARNYPTEDALMVSGFLSMMLIVLFWAAGFMALWMMGPPLMLILFCIAAKHWKTE